MQYTPLPAGKPGQDLGISHTLKHWLNPAEQWEDLALSVDEKERPRAMWDALSPESPPYWSTSTKPSPEMQGQWARLSTTYAHGYLQVAHGLLSTLPEPTSPRSGWILTDRKRRVWSWIDAANGVVIRVQKADGSWALYTVFRPQIAAFGKVTHPPMDPTSVKLRKQVFGLRAARNRLFWAKD
mgnify:CR=1 FL=1